MSPSLRLALPVALLALAGGSHPALAQTAQDYGTLTIAPFYTNVASFTSTTSASSPTFNRPALTIGIVNPAPTGKSGLGSAVGYDSSGFTAATDGAYRVTTTINSGYVDPTMSATGAYTDNFVQVLYGPGGFTPTAPLTNAVLVYSQKQSGSSYQTSLKSGGYTLVNAGYYNSTLTGTKLSVGSATTSVDLFNAGTLKNIVSGNVDGSGTTTETETLSLTGGSPITAFNSIVITGLADAAAGNLTATLSHNGLSATLFDQPAFGDFGQAASYDASQTYRFADTGADLTSTLNAAVNTGTDPFPVASNTFKSLGSLSVFNGAALAGDWTLSITDNGTSSIPVTGSFLGFTFSASSLTPAAVPESSTWVGMGLGCLTLGFLVRRRLARAASFR